MRENSPLHVLVVDDHLMFGDSLRYLLQARSHSIELEQVTDTETAIERLANPTLPDILLLDLNLRGGSGHSLLQQLQHNEIWVPTLVVTASRSLRDAESVMELGALGFVPKDASGEQLLQAIDTIIAGGSYNYFEHAKPSPAATAITPRQHDVLQMLFHGYSNKNIADKLGISEHTVKAHLHELYRTLNVRNRTACIREAQHLGLV